MQFQKILLTIGFLLISSTHAGAQGEIPKVGDTYIISRDDNRNFRGSHRIYNSPSDGLVEVGSPVDKANRFAAIRDAFNAQRKDKAARAFHDE